MTPDLFSPLLQEALTPILVNFGLAVAVAFIGFVGRALHGFINANKNDKNFTFLTSVAEKAVQAAEQLYRENNGGERKDYALQFIETWLKKNNIKIDVSAIETAIEAAVMTEFNFPASVEPAPSPSTTDVVQTKDADPAVEVTTPVGGGGDKDAV